MIQISYSDKFVLPLPEGHKFPMLKYELIRDQLLYEGTASSNHFFCPEMCPEEIITLTHASSYLHKLRAHELSEMEIRKIGFPFSDILVNRCLTSTQGTITCALKALEYGISLNTAGGTHHAFSNRAEGFCIFNDIAVAANYLLSQHLCKKILVIDLDVHQGNGTAHIFNGSDAVFTFSMHGKDNYPLKKEVSDLDIELRNFMTDNEYLALVNYHVPHLLNTVKPDIVFYQAGVDILNTDKLGKLSVTKQGCKQRDEIVIENCKKLEIPLVVTMGGGYSEQIKDTVDAHCNTFRTAFEIW